MPFFIYVTLLCATVCCVRHTGGAETDDQAEATATKAIICKPGNVLFNIAKKKRCNRFVLTSKSTTKIHNSRSDAHIPAETVVHVVFASSREAHL